MYAAVFSSGLSAGLAELQRAAAAVSFDRPLWLLLTLFPLLISITHRLHRRRDRRAGERIGNPESVAKLRINQIRSSAWSRIAQLLFWWTLAVGVAGPRWGKDASDGVAIGRDVMLVVDLSGSMRSQDLSDNRPRWQAAVDACIGLIDAAENRGGHRVGVVIFAARPRLIVPLTTDLEHVRAILKSLDGTHPPEAIQPLNDQAVSGTRIGAALTLAVNSIDARFADHQDLILLTDADDPVSDGEWDRGVTAARQANIPVHVVGIGDPDHDFQLILRDPVITRLQEQLAKSIAEQSLGTYLPVRRDPARLGDFFRAAIEPRASRDLNDDLSPQPVNRSHWFYSIALLMILLLWGGSGVAGWNRLGF